MDAERTVREFVDADPATLVGVFGESEEQIRAAQAKARLILAAAAEPVAVTVTVHAWGRIEQFPRVGVCAGPPKARAAYLDWLRAQASRDAAEWLAGQAA